MNDPIRQVGMLAYYVVEPPIGRDDGMSFLYGEREA